MYTLSRHLKDLYGVHQALSMDQSGSTMWIRGERPHRGGVVSHSHSSFPDIEDRPRNVSNGVFVELVGKNAVTH